MEDLVLPQTESGSGFEPVLLRQFTIFLENRVGRLQHLVRALEHGPYDIITIAVEESADSALVRMICLNPDKCRVTLQSDGFAFTESEVIAVELPRRAKLPLMGVTAALLSAEINIHYMYPLLQRPRGPALILYVEDPTFAARLLIRRRFTLLGESDFDAPDIGPTMIDPDLN
jgi:hypothetical protein